jgi:hypothetical protein
MKLTYLIAVCLLLLAAVNTFAQTKPPKIERQVLASTGAGIAIIDVLQVEYTIGEAVIVPLLTVPGIVLTQGFQQPPTGRVSIDALNDDLVLFPNPSTDKVSIKFTLDSNALTVDVRIVNLMGQTMFTDKLEQPESVKQSEPFLWTLTYSFDTNELRLIPGIYILQIKTNTGFKVTKKFLKLK